MPNAQEVLEWMDWKDREKKLKANMTNEEWLKQCTTEQLAEILVCMAEDKSEAKTVHKENVGKCVEWLKQPHSEE